MFFGKRADTGVGTLIMFIAMIIVAGITANVLVQSAQSMQNKALHTGEQARRAVSTFVETNRITGVNISSQFVNDLRIDVKLAPGSDPIDLEYSMMSVDTSTSGYTYTYSSGDCERGQNGYEVNESGNNGTFTVRYLLEGSSHSSGYISKGDRVELCIALGEPLREDTKMSVSFEPQSGMSTETSFVSPNIMTSERARLYP
ncbi:MAG: hypothetical protein ACLFNK_03010 [Candidatus Woesearchaeota archaeon]